MKHGRRAFFRFALSFSAGCVLPRAGLSQEGSRFPFTDDHGKQVYNYRLPSDLSIEGLPGVLWAGSNRPDVMLVEFFDYNCPYCAAAAKDLAALIDEDHGLRLGLVNNPVLSPGSVQAAKVQQAVLRAYGPAKAYAFHQRMFEEHGTRDGPSALRLVAALGLDAKRVEPGADLPQIGEVVRRQAALAELLGFAATPSFMVGNTGILGYPGAGAMARAIAATRRCDKLVCQG